MTGVISEFVDMLPGITPGAKGMYIYIKFLHRYLIKTIVHSTKK